MAKVLNGLCLAGLGGLLAGALILVVVLSYSYELPSGNVVIAAVSVGTLLGLVAGVIWGRVATRWLLEALMNL